MNVIFCVKLFSYCNILLLSYPDLHMRHNLALLMIETFLQSFCPFYLNFNEKRDLPNLAKKDRFFTTFSSNYVQNVVDSCASSCSPCQSPRNFFFRYYLSSAGCLYLCMYVCMYLSMLLRLQPHFSSYGFETLKKLFSCDYLKTFFSNF